MFWPRKTRGVDEARERALQALRDAEEKAAAEAKKRDFLADFLKDGERKDDPH